MSFASGRSISSVVIVAMVSRANVAWSEPSPVCEPVRVVPSIEPLPPPWKAALAELVESASGTTRPWDCSGAEIALTHDAAGMTLHVKLRDGRSIARLVPTPDLVNPTGEAVLAAPPEIPLRDDTASRVQKTAPIKPISNAPKHSPLGSPRVMFEVGAFTRYTHPPNALWAGGSFRVTVPFGPWSGAAWARFELPIDVIDRVPSDFSINEVSIGVALGRVLLASPVELRLSLDTSAAVVSMQGGDGPATADGSRTDFRIGPDLQATWPFARYGRYFLGSDFELGPADIAHPRRIRPTLPPLPAFTLGLGTGVGLGIL